MLNFNFFTQTSIFIQVFAIIFILVVLTGGVSWLLKKAVSSLTNWRYQHLVMLYLWPIIMIVSLGAIIRLWPQAREYEWVFRLSQTIAVFILINTFIRRNTENKFYLRFTQLIILPLCLSYFMGWLGNIGVFLSSFKFSIGNIHITLNDILRTLLFGALLFWLGKESNSKGKEFIRKRPDLDLRSKEIFAKGLEISLVILFLFLILEIAGVDITALAIFGGAVGVGVGLGLQSIASNFISGIIVLLDRSISLGDHLEFEDGQQGIVTALNLRSATIETYEGKDVIIPNERFVTSSFVNWTHKNQQQRYSINLQVSYQTDLHALFDLLRKTVASHPQVLKGEKYDIEIQPDAEIAGFGDNGVDILIEFWMDGIDDGKNRVRADILLKIWDAFKKHNIEIPYPQRDVRVITQNPAQ